MAQKSYKVGEAVEVVYQALNAASGKTVNMEVWDESHTLVAGGPVVLTELGSSGRYYGTFIPDAEGEWNVQIQEADGTGKVVKAFSVGSHHLKDVGATVDEIKNDTSTLGTNVGIVEGKVDAADAKIVTATSKVDAVDAKIVTLDGKIDDLALNVDAIESPPMVG